MSLRVLLADDSAVVRLALARRFRLAGHEVVEAANVAEACVVDPHTVDVAVLDFDLGDGWGDQIAARLRAGHANLPIAFFTSTDAGETEERLRPYGPTFAKPGDTDALVAWVAKHAPA